MDDGNSSQARLMFDNVSVAVQGTDGPRTLMQNISLNLYANQLVVLSGASGSGKSTLLRAVIRLHPIETGRILLDGKPINDFSPPELRRRVGYLWQFPVFSAGTVRDALCEPFAFRKNHDSPPSKEQLQNQVIGLGFREKFLDQQTGKLSGGEAQRVALARALALQPDVLLLDEPTASLDSENEIMLARLVQNWVEEEGHAAIWVTHDRALINELGVETWALTPSGLLREEVPA